MEDKLLSFDILFCKSNGLLGKSIRKATGGEVSHTALYVVLHGKKVIIEAQAKGIHIISFENWKKKYNYEYFAYRNNKHDVKLYQQEILEEAFSKLGITGYDFLSLLWYQPRYIITGKWKGRTGEDAEKRIYCSEFNALLEKVEEFYKMSPQDFLNYVRQHNEKYFKVE